MTEINVSENGVEELNREVAKQINAAYMTNHNTIEHTYAANNIENGMPVYKHRSIVAMYVLVTYAVLALIATPIPLWKNMFWAVFMYFYIDFYGGLLHFVLDHKGNLKLPLISEACLEFQWHHNIPYDIASQPFYEVVGALNILSLVKLGFTLSAWLYVAFTHRANMASWLVISAWAYLWAVVGQWSHRQAHTSPHKRPVLAVALQSIGVLIEPKQHKAHHDAAFEEPHSAQFGRTYPILHGKTGWLLEACLNAVPSAEFWTLAWLMLTFGDVFLFLRLLQGISNVFLSLMG